MGYLPEEEMSYKESTAKAAAAAAALREEAQVTSPVVNAFLFFSAVDALLTALCDDTRDALHRIFYTDCCSWCKTKSIIVLDVFVYHRVCAGGGVVGYMLSRLYHTERFVVLSLRMALLDLSRCFSRSFGFAFVRVQQSFIIYRTASRVVLRCAKDGARGHVSCCVPSRG